MMQKTKRPVNQQRLAIAMAIANLNKRQLAVKMGMRRPHLWRRTAGQTTWSRAEIHLLVEILGVSEEWLFTFSEPDNDMNNIMSSCLDSEKAK